MDPDRATVEARMIERERARDAHGAELGRRSRVLLTAYPRQAPKAVALLDVANHRLETFVGDEMASLGSRLAAFEILAAVEVRALLRELGFAPGDRRLAELGPPRKTRKLNQAGRTLRISTKLLVQGSCGIARPFGEERKLAEYLAKGEHTKLRRRLEADVKSLYALYEYGRLHRAVRLRWGFLDERIPAPWVHFDEPTLATLKKSALAQSTPLEVVVGSAPGWEQPWSRGRLARVEQEAGGWGSRLVDEEGYLIPEADVQRARLSAKKD
jgi:hypothetical protein